MTTVSMQCSSGRRVDGRWKRWLWIGDGGIDGVKYIIEQMWETQGIMGYNKDEENI